MLPDERVRLHGAIRVHLGHVHVVQEVDELLIPGRAIILTSLKY